MKMKSSWAETRRLEGFFVLKDDKRTETLMIEDDVSLIEVGEGEQVNASLKTT